MDAWIYAKQTSPAKKSRNKKSVGPVGRLRGRSSRCNEKPFMLTVLRARRVERALRDVTQDCFVDSLWQLKTQPGLAFVFLIGVLYYC